MPGPQSQLVDWRGGAGGRQMEKVDGKIAKEGLELWDLRPWAKDTTTTPHNTHTHTHTYTLTAHSETFQVIHSVNVECFFLFPKNCVLSFRRALSLQFWSILTR